MLAGRGHQHRRCHRQVQVLIVFTFAGEAKIYFCHRIPRTGIRLKKTNTGGLCRWEHDRERESLLPQELYYKNLRQSDKTRTYHRLNYRHRPGSGFIFHFGGEIKIRGDNVCLYNRITAHVVHMPHYLGWLTRWWCGSSVLPKLWHS